ncbi:MAG: hypothetical protein ACK451_23140, partial [Pseudanabaena sp.]
NKGGSHCLETIRSAPCTHSFIGKSIMALKTTKQATPPDLVAQSAAPLSIEINLEEAIADELLNDIDWAKVRSALISKAKQKFISMLFGGGQNTPINISQFPELAALPSNEDKAS